jgi:hypothetical protein
MNSEILSAISNCIDNVYNNTAEQAEKRTVVKLKGEVLQIDFITVLNFAKEIDQHHQLSLAESEANQYIKQRFNQIKASIKHIEKATFLKKDSSTSIETLTVSPYSPMRKLLYKYTVLYEL